MTTKTNPSKSSKKDDKSQQKIDELTLDLQRTRADFENYRKRVEQEKEHARTAGKSGAILKLLPVIDNIERAIAHAPEELKDNKWAQGVANLVKNLEKSLESLEVKRIEAKPGTQFDPAFHEAIQFDEDAEGDKEVVAEELQAGYMLGNTVVRHSMVKVTRK
jgi:molecular chaperone GrpE